MAVKVWQVCKIRHCDHVGHEIALESEVVYPADHLPETPPRIIARRCSHAMVCNQFENPACVWCGTNPDYDPV